MDGTESNNFSSKIHLFPTNSLVNVHNRCMLKSLGIPIARCIAEHTKNKYFSDADDDHLQQEVILACIYYVHLPRCPLETNGFMI